MHTTDPSEGASSTARPWATGRHRKRTVAMPEQRTGPEPGAASPTSPAPTSPAPDSRGRTEIADRVVQKIAAAALGEVEEIGGPARRAWGIATGSGTPDHHRPRVTVTVHGTTVDLDVRASVRRAAPVAGVVERARARVTARIAETTGLQVRRLDVTVTALPTGPSPSGRVLR